jgi:hypothetical protein
MKGKYLFFRFRFQREEREGGNCVSASNYSYGKYISVIRNNIEIRN